MTKNLSFEDAMKELDTIVQKLEEGNIELEEALSIYKRGVELSQLCHTKLKNAEDQLTKVLTDEGEVDFDVSEGEEV